MRLSRTERGILALLVISGLLGLGLRAWRGSRSTVAVRLLPATEQAALEETLRQARRIHRNTADAEAFTRLPGIGPTLAERIVVYRRRAGPFRRIEDVLEVPGIGPKTFAAIEDFLTVE